MVFHMDGNLYFDWSRKEPVPEVKAKKVKAKKVKKAKKEEPRGYPDSCEYTSQRCGYVGGNGRCGFGSGMC